VSEILVVDDGSSDQTRVVAESVPGVKVLSNPGDGAESARQHGFQAATGEFVIFLDSDDLLHPQHVEILVDAATEHPEYVGYVSDVVEFRDAPIFSPLPASDLEGAERYPWARLPGCMTVSPGSVLVRRDVLDAQGGWQDGDLFMWLRLGDKSAFWSVPAGTFYYRLHDGQLINSMSRRKDPASHLRWMIEGIDRVLQTASSKRQREAYPVMEALLATEEAVERLYTADTLLPAHAHAWHKALSALPKKRIGPFCQLVAWSLALRLRRDADFRRRLMRSLSVRGHGSSDATFVLLGNLTEKVPLHQLLTAEPVLHIAMAATRFRVDKWRASLLPSLSAFLKRRFPALRILLRHAYRSLKGGERVASTTD